MAKLVRVSWAELQDSGLLFIVNQNSLRIRLIVIGFSII